MIDTNQAQGKKQNTSYLLKRRKLLKASAAAPLVATLTPNVGAAAASAFQCAEKLADEVPQVDCGIKNYCAGSGGDTWKRQKVELGYVQPAAFIPPGAAKSSKSSKRLTDSKTSKSANASKSTKASDS